MRADFALVLDASVLANHPVADLLLRLAEKPRLHLRRWSPQILEETLRTHLSRLRWPESIASSFQEPIQSAFPEAMVHGLEPLIEACGNGSLPIVAVFLLRITSSSSAGTCLVLPAAYSRASSFDFESRAAPS